MTSETLTSDTLMGETFDIEIDGQKIKARRGQTLAEVLLTHGFMVTRKTLSGAPRGVFCGMGVCHECRAVVNGRPNVRTCQTLARPGDRVEIQDDARLTFAESPTGSMEEAV